jgi:pimeloyl-ACP methyl ester carboxylesterase
MKVILVPGFWLGAWAWDAMSPALEKAGHTVTALTLPGLAPTDTDRASIGLDDHINFVTHEIDRVGSPVVLVGHSAGGAVAHAAASRRPDSVVRVVHVDTWPAAEGRCITDGLPQQNGEIPLPAWDMFDDEDLVDLDDRLRSVLRSCAVPQPSRTATEPFEYPEGPHLSVPTTVVACEFSSAQLQAWMADGAANLALLAQMTDVTWVDLPTGHWPMLTRPADLAAVLVAAVGN